MVLYTCMVNCSKEHSISIVEKYWKKEWDKIKQVNFPKTREFEITNKECYDELSRLYTEFKSGKAPSKIIIKFHPSLKYANRKGRLSPYNYWQLLKEDENEFKRFYENRLRCSDWFNEKQGANFHYLDEGYVPEFIYGIGMTTSGKAPFVSYFKPFLAKNLIYKYLNKFDTIFDPCCGYSGRMLGTLALHKNYIGYDINDLTIQECNNVYSFVKSKYNGLLKLKETVTLKCLDSLKNNGTFDCLFTCTPYKDIECWQNSSNNKIESNLSCDEWVEQLMGKYKCKKYLFVVDNGTKYKNNIVEELENTSHFGKNKEYVLLFEG